MDKGNQNKLISNTEEMSLKDLILKIKHWFQYLLSKWIVILLVGLMGAACGFAYSLIKAPVYKAELSFVLQDERSGGGLSGALGLASQFGIDVGGVNPGGEFSGDNVLEFMKSRSIVEKVLLTPVTINGKNETLAEFYIDINKLRSAWQNDPQLNNLYFLVGQDRKKFSLKQDSILGLFYKKLVANNFVVDKEDKKLSIITVKVSSTNEMFSKYFAEILVKVVSDFYIQTKTKKSMQNVDILQHQTDSVRQALNTAITGVASSIDATPNSNPFLQTLHVPSQRRQVDVQASTAILNELVKNLEVAKMSLLQETPLIQIIDRPILPLEKEKLGKIKGSLLGGLLAGIVCVIFLSIRKIYNAIVS